MAAIAQVNSNRVPTPLAHYSQGSRVGDLIFLAGQLASDWRTGVPAELRRRPGYPFYGSDIASQTRFVLENIRANLEDAGSDLEHVVKTQVFLLDNALFDEFDAVWKEFFPTPPPRTTVQTGPKGLLVPGTLVEIDVIAVAKDSGTTPRAVSSDRTPVPIANYTPAVQCGDFVFLAGQLATDFQDGGVPAEARVDPNYPYYASDIERQTEYTLNNIKLLLEDAGSDLEHVVKAQVFLKDLGDFHGFDDVWRRFFPTPPPRTTLQIADLLIEGALVEIDLIAVRKDVDVEFVNTDNAPRPKANYSQAAIAGDLVFLAGQLASDFRTGVPPEAAVDPAFPFYGSDIELQTEFVLGNLKAVLEAAGTSLDRVVKTQTFLTDLDHFHGYDKVWKRHFDTPPPRTTIELDGDGLLVARTLVEIDLIASRA
jgi:reactive intermediate/imine deaminase